MDVLRGLRKYQYRRLNRSHPFGIGSPEYVERIVIGSRIRQAGQGALVSTATPDFDFGLRVGNEMFSKQALQLAFRFAQNNLSNPDTASILHPHRVFGFISDGLLPNGIAGLVDSKIDTTHFLNVTAGAFFLPLASALHWMAHRTIASKQGSAVWSGTSHQFLTMQIGLEEIQIPSEGSVRAHAANIARCALLSTVYHEFAHIIRGHTRWANQAWNQSELRERDDGVHAVTAGSRGVRRLLETDADLISGAYLASFVKRSVTGDMREGLPLAKSLLLRATTMLRGIILMYSWFAMSDQYHSGLVRIHVVLIGLAHALAPLDPDDGLISKLIPMVEETQTQLVDLGLLPRAAANFIEGDAYAMVHESLERINKEGNAWLALSPLGPPA